MGLKSAPPGAMLILVIENDSANETFSLSLPERDRERVLGEPFIPHPSPLPGDGAGCSFIRIVINKGYGAGVCRLPRHSGSFLGCANDSQCAVGLLRGIREMSQAEKAKDAGPGKGEDPFDWDDEDTQKDKFLTFTIAREDYGLEIQFITEIIGIQKITDVPDMPDYVKGVINLRGQVIPVLDIRARFEMPPREFDDRTCIVVVSTEETTIGLIVDTVKEVRDIPEENIAPPPSVSKGPASRYIQGMGKVGDEVKIILNLKKLLFDKAETLQPHLHA